MFNTVLFKIPAVSMLSGSVLVPCPEVASSVIGFHLYVVVNLGQVLAAIFVYAVTKENRPSPDWSSHVEHMQACLWTKWI